MKRLLRFGIAVLVLLAVLFLAGFPARTYLEQRNALAGTADRLSILKKSNGQLAAQVKDLQSPDAVERLAREQYNLVRPGEEAYAILPGPASAAPKPAAKAVAPVHKQSFVSQLLDKLTFWSK